MDFLFPFCTVMEPLACPPEDQQYQSSEVEEENVTNLHVIFVKTT